MTSRQRVLKALKREAPDRVPALLYGELVGYVPQIAEMLAEKCAGVTPRDYFDFDMTSFTLAPTREQYDYSKYIPIDQSTVIDEWGVGRRVGKHFHYSKIIHPLQNLDFESIQKFPFPDLDQPYRYHDVADKIVQIHEQGRAAAYFAGSIFETAWQLRGMEQLFSDIINGTAIAEFLLNRITEIVTESARYLAQRDLDLLILGDDIASQSGMIMSLEMWRKNFKTRLMKVIQAAKETKPTIHVLYHSDGNVWDAIPDLIEAGVDVLNPVQPECMDPAKVKRVFGEKLSFLGTISVQKTMPFGTPDDVRNEVKLRIETIGKNGGLLLAPAHVLQPDTPWENIVAFIDAVKEYGYY